MVRGFDMDQISPPEEYTTVLIFATGSGICPIRSLIESGFSANKRSDVRLYYGARNLQRMAYQNRRNSGCIDKKLWSTSMDVWLLFSALGLKSLFCHRSFMFINDMVALNESFSPMNTYG
ncbi:hypothetical protein HHK36_006851 [Tetracentron sinense]|uniref:Oxidoreductase FAD/NAD(P)-binding domain-containing protein n=1 Tax=Tetracentron sinense TaxID=13715 RepID=A0A835DLA2_TETSI|nr:hypothetical protein HHK36_006851 [Tetracentron sinense]